MCYFHLLIGLISSKTYWTVTKKTNSRFKRNDSNEKYIYEILTKIQTKEEKLNISDT